MYDLPVPSDESVYGNDSDTSGPGDAEAHSMFIQHGSRNMATISRKIQGLQITQIGKENVANMCTDRNTFRVTVSSKKKDVEAIVNINLIKSDEDIVPTLEQETQMEMTAGKKIIVRIEVDEQAKRHTRPRNGCTIACDLHSITRDILTSLFERVNMIVNYFRRGSIIIGLQPQTDRAVFTLLNAMEGGFIEELVRGIIENEPDWNFDGDSGKPIKMKIDINIPQGMFPKEFHCKKFASRKELLQELKVSFEKKEKEETVEKEIGL